MNRRFHLSSLVRKDEDVIKIGSVTKAVSSPRNHQFVPVHYLQKETSSSTVHHLQWMMKKDLLGQDMFLIGLPGPLRARTVLQYLEMVQKETEYMVLTRDTTENDLKQRREIKDGTARYVDQAAVRAAIEGRFLVLDGVEKVERNVLPVLNNLLENRELQLEDGRFLVASDRFDKLLLEHTKEELDRWKIVRVSEDFRVVALGLPVPHFKGNPLDPPFRSRFQARHVTPNFEEQMEEISRLKNLSEKAVKNFMLACHTFLSDESATLGMPKFPVENTSLGLTVWSSVPEVPVEQVFSWIYPYTLLLPKDGQNSVLKTLEKFSIKPLSVKTEYNIKKNESKNNLTHTLEIKTNRNKALVQVHGHRNLNADSNFVSNPYHEGLLANMLMTHCAHDFCVIGPRGSGKATMVRKFASLLNYPVEMVMLYNDMTARDLMQQRITDENGNTLWRPSQLIKAAESGKLLVLDGLHRLHSSTFSVLQHLVHNREMQLYDGTRLLRHDRYDTLKDKLLLSDQEMRSKKLLRIHPAFRIVALAEPPKLQSKKDNWINPELLSMFLFHTVRPLSLKEEKIVIQSSVKNLSKKIDPILQFTHKLRNSKDDALKNISASFSTRQLIRMARRLELFPEEDIYNLVTQSCLMKFLPPLTKQSLDDVLRSSDIYEPAKSDSEKQIVTSGDTLQIGNTSSLIYRPEIGQVKVPNIVFYNSEEHITVMESMLQNFLLGEHLLLVGNQGVGKNKIADRFLQLLNRPREYIQLHRDTTVQSLTQQPTVVDGRIIYDDSPLLRAVQYGHVLVIDEADKAPTHVTSILKALVVSGEMHLSDGRCIVHPKEAKPDSVVMHPDFRMIVLANRPGFPFLGNDFFATLGDIFSCHAVDNPSLESEISMLRKYGPNVPENLLRKLSVLFGELRSLSDGGLISYPYSTREVVNIVKHLNKFPEEGMPYVLKNVFDFDFYSSELKETLSDIFKRHGIPLENEALSVKLAHKYKLPKLCFKSKWCFDGTSNVWESKTQPLQFSNKSDLPVKEEPLNVSEARANVFSEQSYYCQLPLKANDIPLDIASTSVEGNEITYVATGNPVSLFTINNNRNLLSSINLSPYFPTVRSGFKPKLKISPVDIQNEHFVLMHESITNQTFLIHPTNGSIDRINISSLFDEAIYKISSIYGKNSAPYFQLNSYSKAKPILWDKVSGKIVLLNFDNLSTNHIQSSNNIENVHILDNNTMIMTNAENKSVVDFSNLENWNVRYLNEDSLRDSPYVNIKNGHSKKSTQSLEGNKEISLMSNLEDYACIISGSFLKDTSLRVKSYPREYTLSDESGKTVILTLNNQIARFIQFRDLPQHVKTQTNLDCIEIVNVDDESCNYIEIDLPYSVSSFASWLADSSKPYLIMAPTTDGNLITADARGCVRKWEINRRSLENSFECWKASSGLENKQKLTIERVSGQDVSSPKHGKVDPTGAPHVGGNMWAGGTGGRDTAGLGGKGGPYRLDAGHNVYQLSDEEKDSVPPEVKEAARQMGLKAYKERLKEIEMSEYDADLYNQFFKGVEKQVKMLKVILDGLQAKSKDRQWLRHQTSGELDDTKLIEGITGEKSIYKRRGEQEPEMGSPLEKPKLLRFVVDVSGSMYRFNGHDDRLQRQLESVVLVMEAFDKYQDKFKYEIVGHSGEEYNLEFSKFDRPPKNEKERLDLIRNMIAHSQFCISGDHTLEATDHAIRTITKEDADEYFVVVLSDANFDRYGISPTSFGNLLNSDPKVNAFAIFVGSLGDQAAMLSKRLPAGRAFICLDSADITQIMQKIFTSALLKD
ncbi:hypothetical protein JTE90_005415 [Oedothorax gibbosus]|uniref:von Willebrand factor A domain-containing protein 8 n=1 Tax=Oedothorax gibbosus TaxID=931172 RepID=A0AAV6UPP3_9ARAC|nr:hypothetical protein JTE90_005415 [Oedothorax gibbosus]